MFTVYAASDPNAPARELWHYVYLHAAAEHTADDVQNANVWEWQPADLCVIALPHPTEPGEYPCTVYGRPAVAFLRPIASWTGAPLGGYVALIDDDQGTADARENARRMEGR